MESLTNPIVRLWQWWFTPRSNDPTVIYRERALRVLLPIISVLRVLGTFRSYSNTSDLPTPYVPLWVNTAVFIIPILFSIYLLIRQQVGWAGGFFILHWYLADLLSLPAEGYWYPGYQISIIIQGVLSALFLPSRAILPFLFLQLTTIGIWGHWLDVNYFDPPLLSTGEPVASFWRAFPTLAAQETIILFIVRYLRMQMEKSLRIQQVTIRQLQREVTDRQRAEEAQEKLIQELGFKNAELERFTYTVSHDLKSPIVTIKGFLGMLVRDMEENRSDRIQSDLRRIESATDKMEALLKDLLELSRIGRIVNPPVEVDTIQLIKDAIENGDARLRSKDMVITISPDLPILFGDRIRLREVFENLLDNAAKYTGNRANSVIEISKREQNDEIVFYVKDNGIGIDPRYRTRIFNLFEKLDPTIEGTGVGLTLVKRIIEVHGGKIWVESEGIGKGSTFCFTIPDRRKQNTTQLQIT